MTEPISKYEASEWTVHAVCSAKDEMTRMFPDNSDKDGIEAAKANCRVCPVRIECLSAALDRGEQWGVWGGFTTEERKLFRRRQQRNGRPMNDIRLPDIE